MAPSKKGLSKEEILKLLNELSENESCDENASNDDENFVTNDESTIEENVRTISSSDSSSSDCEQNEYIPSKNAHIISSSEYSSSDNELNENIPKQCSSGIRKTKKCKSFLNKKNKGEQSPLQTDLEEAKDGTIWKIRQQSSVSFGRRSIQNILKENPGPTPYSKRSVSNNSPVSSWRLFINDKILNIIKKCTEAEARSKLNNETWSISLDELDSFIAILYVRGALAAKGVSITSLWSKTWGHNFFPSTMNRNRFLEIMRFIRFDLKISRSDRLKEDKFALISDVWNTFIENCFMCYKPGENITVDEQLFPSKTRCRFLQYMPNKPDKFGIKFWLAVDVSSKYIINAFPYLGKDDSKSNDLSVGENAALRLVKPYLKTGRNITSDSFFTSLKLVENLKENGLSYVGTINRAKREVPKSLKKTKKELYSTTFMTHNNTILVSYQCKKYKNVLLLSTLHSSLEVTQNEKKTPEIIKFYNSTKFGVDVVDQMARKYSVKSASRRWPMHVFFNILDLAAINAWVVFKETTGSKLSRRDYILKLAEELREKYIVKKTSDAKEVIHPRATPEISNKRKRCQIKQCKDNKTNTVCEKCSKFVCGLCTAKKEMKNVVFCVKCFERK